MRQPEAENALEKGNQTFLRNYNTGKVLYALRCCTALSRVELAERTNLDKKTISNIISDLLEKGMVHVSALHSEGAGRPKEMLEINGDYALYAGIDLGGTHLSGVIVDFTCAVIASYDVDVNNDMEPDTLLRLCYFLMDNLLKKAGLEEKDLHGIGISFPGFVTSSNTGDATSENLPKWKNIPVRKLFADRYHLPIHVDDCSRLMALAESWFGKGRDCDNFIVADLGLGIGCGIMIDRKIFRGSNGKSGEVGHTVVDVNGPLCTCGKHGCIESYSAGWALARQAAGVKEKHPDSLLHETSSSMPPSIQQVALAANLGDPYCLEMLQRAGEYIGIGFSNAISFFNPSRLILGGRLVKENEIMLHSIIDTIKSNCMAEILDDVEITVSELGISASAWGAGIMCVQGTDQSGLNPVVS